MDKKMGSVLWTMIVVLVIMAVLILFFGNRLGIERFQTDQATLVLRFLFVIIGLLAMFLVYWFTRDNAAWEVGTRQVVWMAIGAALYAVFSWFFNATVFVIPSLSQVALRPAIAIPMFFGYAFGPVVGLFTGIVGNTFGDAITGFGLSPQWSVGNGLVGFIAGLSMIFGDRRKSLNAVLIIGGILTGLATAVFIVYPNLTNMVYFNPGQNVFGDQPIAFAAGISVLIGFIMVVIVRFAFGKNISIAAAVTWAMLGNIIGILFASLSDVFINGFSVPAAIVGEFLPAAGPNLIFAAILVPLLVAAYAAVQRQSGR